MKQNYAKVFPCSSVGQESAYNAGDSGSIPRSGRSPGEGNGNPFQYSCVQNPMDRGAWQAIVHGVSRVGHDLVTKPPPHAKDTSFGFLLWVTKSNSNCYLSYLSCPPFPHTLCSVPLGLPLITYTFPAAFSLRTFIFLTSWGKIHIM